MTIVTPRSRLFDALHFGAIIIGIIALTGYVLGNASIAALSANGKPVSVVTALVLIALGVGLLALGVGVILHKHDSDRARLASIVESSDDAIIGTSSAGLIESWNAGAEQTYRYTAAEAIGRSVTMLAPPERQDEAPRILERVWRGERVDPVETVRVTKDGRRIDVLLSISRILDADGSLVGTSFIQRDITERKRIEESLQLAQRQLQALSRHLLAAQEVERHRIARELHDEIGQALTAIKINLQTLKQFPDLALDASRLDESVSIVDRALGQVHTLSLELRPPMLDDLGLVVALRWLVEEHARRTGLAARFRHSLADVRFDTAVETACFRIVQEALNNVVRHAGAQHASVDLHLQESMLHVRVRDDGAGFDVDAARRRAVQGTSFGLLSMEERVTLAGGAIEWRSAPGEGAEVHAWFPLPRPSGTNDETAATA